MDKVKIKVKTAAEKLPVTLEELRANLRLTSSALDSFLLQYLTNAVATAENYTGRIFMPTTLLAYLDSYPEDGELIITKGPVETITAIKYFKEGDSEATTVASTSYQLDNIEIDARLKFGVILDPDPARLNAIEIEYVGGWASAELVPRSIKDAIILMASERYMNPVSDGILPQARYLLNDYKNKRF